jgi:hypothetical protein
VGALAVVADQHQHFSGGALAKPFVWTGLASEKWRGLDEAGGPP